MIILTQPGIKAFNPTRVSSIVNYYDDYCLAEVPDDFDLSEQQMHESKINFWWAVEGNLLSGENYKLRKYKGGIIEGICNQLNVSKEQNIAFGIYSITSCRYIDEWQLWERSILL